MNIATYLVTDQVRNVETCATAADNITLSLTWTYKVAKLDY